MVRVTCLGGVGSVTGSNYLVESSQGKKVIVEATLSAEGEVCARGEVVAVKMPEQMMPKVVTA